mmetsp:Transcript_46556/g.149497  ORF Transcript_46556/g.149497 Transcript_46556/m.149497 type:complete len:195 (+) Transcript_46556:194-778(+)
MQGPCKAFTSVAMKDVFFQSPHVMSMPAALGGENACFNVVLVDAPPGKDERSPGRQASSYWAARMAFRCARETGRPVKVFIHDVERALESEITAKMFVEKGMATKEGRTIYGAFGDLELYTFNPGPGEWIDGGWEIKANPYTLPYVLLSFFFFVFMGSGARKLWNRFNYSSSSSSSSWARGQENYGTDSEDRGH